MILGRVATAKTLSGLDTLLEPDSPPSVYVYIISRIQPGNGHR